MSNELTIMFRRQYSTTPYYMADQVSGFNASPKRGNAYNALLALDRPSQIQIRVTDFAGKVVLHFSKYNRRRNHYLSMKATEFAALLASKDLVLAKVKECEEFLQKRNEMIMDDDDPPEIIIPNVESVQSLQTTKKKTKKRKKKQKQATPKVKVTREATPTLQEPTATASSSRIVEGDGDDDEEEEAGEILTRGDEDEDDDDDDDDEEDEEP